MSIIKKLFAVREEGGLTRGRRLGLLPQRRFIVEYLNYTRQVPSQPLARDCDFLELNQLRKGCPARIGWTTIFTKAYGILASRHPQLRQFFMRWPWGSIYEHPHQVARIAVTRSIADEDWLFFMRIERPEQQSLTEIQSQITFAQTAPIESIPLFDLQYDFTHLPGFIRRIVWWSLLNFSGTVRAGIAGTYGLTSVAALGAHSIHPPTLGCNVITSSPITPDGRMRVTFVYDHRVYDGWRIATYLEEFEDIMRTQMVDELRSLGEHSSETIAA